VIDRFVVGQVRGSFGVKGFAKIQSYSGETDHLQDLRSVILLKDGVERTIVVEETGGSGLSFIMKFKGYDTPEVVKDLSGWELVVPREKAAALDENEFYIEDLRGVSVFLDGARIGEISDVLEGGGTQLIEIRLDSGEKKLVPFRNEFFGPVDTGTRTAQLLAGWILE
jgi:16S rRNA processing protein RimM